MYTQHLSALYLELDNSVMPCPLAHSQLGMGMGTSNIQLDYHQENGESFQLKNEGKATQTEEKAGVM